MPSIRRAETYHPGDDIRGRSRSRNHPSVEIEEVSEDEPPREKEYRKHRERRHKNRSPEPNPAEYVPRPATTSTSTRYYINGDRRTVPVEEYFGDDSLPRKHTSRHHTYHSSRPSMPPRESSWGGSFKFKTAKAYGDDDISYSSVPHYARDDLAWAQV